jgi:hypothetical protein
LAGKGIEKTMIRFEYLVIVSVAIFCMAATPTPIGWRAPTGKETNQNWRKGRSHHYIVDKADFNGDGTEDEARLLVRQKVQGMALFAFVSQGKSFEIYLLEELREAGWLDVMGDQRQLFSYLATTKIPGFAFLP